MQHALLEAEEDGAPETLCEGGQKGAEGTEPILVQTGSKDKLPLKSLRPAQAVSPAVRGNTFIFSGFVFFSPIFLSYLRSYLCGSEIKSTVKAKQDQ